MSTETPDPTPQPEGQRREPEEFAAPSEITTDFLIAVGGLVRNMEGAILDDMLSGLDSNDEWQRMAHNAASVAARMAVQCGWRPTR